jgi:DNA-binding NarL/FixJ family response regulator
MEQLKIGIIEDDKGIRETLYNFLQNEPDVAFVLAADSVEQFIDMITSIEPNEKPNILLLDINLPGISGIEGIPKLKALMPDSDIIMNSVMQDSSSVFHSLQAGASGYIDKEFTLDKIKEAIVTLSKGGSPMTPAIARMIVEFFNPNKQFDEQLTDREKDIAHGIVDGLSYKLIADRHSISIDTVRKHIRKIYKKLQINSKGELIHKFHKGNF